MKCGCNPGVLCNTQTVTDYTENNKYLSPIGFLKYQTGLNPRCCLLDSG